jgi:LmbE family N-acetylglucosaminyl deacetylase
MKWIFLSPHFDDVALSCGGLVWERAQAGDPVSVCTICAGNPPHRELSSFAKSLHERWETGLAAVARRKAEDIASCAAMQASYQHINIPDCIYRPVQKKIPHYYTSDQDIFATLHPAEKKSLVSRLRRTFLREIAPQEQVVCPLTLGNHVDHQITRLAAEQAARHFQHPLLYYADYPYVWRYPEQIALYQQRGWTCVQFDLTEKALEAWQASIAAHSSQLSTFWSNLEEMRTDISAYNTSQRGICLWKAP